MSGREDDGFLDFKIFVRLNILELKLIIFPTIPPLNEIKQVDQEAIHRSFNNKKGSVTDQMVDLLELTVDYQANSSKRNSN